MQTQYQTAEKEKENQKLQYENKLQKEIYEKAKNRNLFITSTLLFLIILITIVFIFIRKEQKNKFNKQLLNEIDEQNGIISKNLHDGMSGYIHSLRNSIALQRETNKEMFVTEISILKKLEQEMRFLMKQLSSPYYKDKNFSLAEELKDLRDFYEKTSNFKIESYFDQTITWQTINYNNKLQIYKLVQELLANIKKHSAASLINFQMIKEQKKLIVSFEDNGKGFDTKTEQHGYGLKNMHKRIEELKGEMKIDSKQGEGTFISLKLPVFK